jgi:CxxC-x17-CxxC domain-containing protein
LSYADKTIACRDCGQSFTFTVGEQEFFASRGYTNDPSRCPECRASRKAGRDSGGYSGGGGGYSSGGYSSGGYSSGGGGGYGREREMFSVTCSSCGNEARVPFQPRGDKPVYCSDCFSKQGGGRSSSPRSYR